MILVVGLSPAWQRTLFFEGVTLGSVNRAKRVREIASGKGVNVARVAHTLGARVMLLTVAGGARGRLLKRGLRAIPSHVVNVGAETRVCQTLIGSGAVTELVEEAGGLTTREVRQIFAAYSRLVRRARLVVLTGTVPRGCGNDFYARLVAEARSRDVRVIVDAQKQQLVQALRQRPFLVKINRNEWQAVKARRGAQWMIVSNGAREVRVGEDLILRPPAVKARNTIGSGDAMTAGIAVGLVRELAVPEAVWLGIACGAANAMTAQPGVVRRSEVQRLCSTLTKRVPIV